MEYVIYTKINCQKCRLTEKLLKLPKSSQSCDIIKNESALREVQSLGYSSLPFVKILDSKGTELDNWCDLDLSKIKLWNEKYNESKTK